jgi:hypothetical protein
MHINFPVIELIDRLAIAQVKWEKTTSNQAELEWYTNEAKNFNLTIVECLFNELKETHNQIWNLESELKTGRESELPLEEIGRRAIMIRDFNAKRILIKNQIAEKLNCPVREIKKDHLSE